MADQSKYQINVISAFGEGKSGYSGSIPLNAFTEFITGPHDGTSDTLINIDKAYKRVPWLHRGVNLRADSVSYMPCHIERATDNAKIAANLSYQQAVKRLRGTKEYSDGMEIGDQSEYAYLIDRLPRLLALTEKSLVKRGKAFWLIEENRAGKKKTPRYIPSQSVKILTSPEVGIIGYEIQWSSGARQYSVEQMVYFSLENDDSEIEPDVSPAQVALEAAGLLYAANAAPARFYSGGFVPVSLVTVPLTTQKADVEKIENFFKRMATGLKKMFSVLGVYEGVKVETVGHTLKDSVTPDITSAARDDVAVALGIPPTVLDSSSANYATAESEMIGYYINTIFPECGLIASIANEQFFKPIGLTLVFDYELHEIMQTIQLAQASGVVTLTGKPPLTVDEGRAMLGYDEMDEEDKPEEPGPPDTEAESDSAEEDDAELVKALIAEMQESRLTLEKSMSNGNGHH